MRHLHVLISALLLLPAASATAHETPSKVANWMESVVKISQLGRDGQEGLGAGWVVDGEGLIVTNLHVIGRGRRLQVETKDGKRYQVTDVHAWDDHYDLAILRVKEKGLKALQIGDPTIAKQGEPVVAIGNPEGLEFSVVNGVISGKRDIDDVEMIQIAIPIERGNSGGPLLDEAGKVLGTLTLKSMRAENLGFAMPSNLVTELLKKPNSVPISRWLTIGVLDSRTWKVKGGSDWTQRAGVLKSEGMGSGFGGRTLAIHEGKKPSGSYEIATWVKLEEESGAAGLIFCSDGNDRHYGFYPTGGKMRLTRFEGPDVFSWTVLHESPSEAYKAGEWNHLRVRVDPERLTCWVNGQEWHVQEDAAFRDGLAGLCKFRSPDAQYRGFQVGNELGEKAILPEVAERFKKSTSKFMEGASTLGLTVNDLAHDARPATKWLETEARNLEEKAKSMRKLKRNVHQAAVTAELSQLMEKPETEISLLKAALLLARHDNPEVSPAPYLEMLDRMAADLKADAEVKKGGATALHRIAKYLLDENGFHVNRHDDSSSNSYINEVLDDREGLPIMLSTIFLELAKRLNIEGVHGLGLPYRFMVGFRGEKRDDELQIVDVSSTSEILTLAEAAEHIGVDDPAELEPFLKPATKMEILLRMVRNLMGEVADDAPPTDAQAGYLSLQIALQDEAPGERVLRAIYRSKNGDKAGAQDDIQWLLQNTGDKLDEERRAQFQAWYRSLE